jgi:predicted dehydrogenase
MRIFKSNAYVIVDFQRRSLNHYHTGDGEMFPGIPNIVSNELIFENGDALYEEIKHFMDCIYHQQTPLVSGMVGRRALETALKITELLA